DKVWTRGGERTGQGEVRGGVPARNSTGRGGLRRGPWRGIRVETGQGPVVGGAGSVGGVWAGGGGGGLAPGSSGLTGSIPDGASRFSRRSRLRRVRNMVNPHS